MTVLLFGSVLGVKVGRTENCFALMHCFACALHASIISKLIIWHLILYRRRYRRPEQQLCHDVLYLFFEEAPQWFTPARFKERLLDASLQAGLHHVLSYGLQLPKRELILFHRGSGVRY